MHVVKIPETARAKVGLLAKRCAPLTDDVLAGRAPSVPRWGTRGLNAKDRGGQCGVGVTRGGVEALACTGEPCYGIRCGQASDRQCRELCDVTKCDFLCHLSLCVPLRSLSSISSLYASSYSHWGCGCPEKEHAGLWQQQKCAGLLGLGQGLDLVKGWN